jgi:hypothetical protein
MSQPSTKERLRARRQRQKTRSYATRGAVGLVAIMIVGVIVLRVGQLSGGGTPPPEVEPVPTASAFSHVAEGADPGPYNSDPPSSGRHYGVQAFADFYDEAEAASFGPFPAGYLVHSLEHGYVIFWYDCEELAEGNCEDLKADIQQVMSSVGNYKVIAFPWPSLDVPVAMTSWGRLIQFEEFDRQVAEEFVRAHREGELAPEPRAG